MFTKVVAVAGSKAARPVLIVGAAALIIYLLLRKKKTPEEIRRDEQELEAQLSREEYSNELQQKYEFSYPKHKYLEMADALQAAMQGFGTNEIAIYKVFEKMKNPLDLETLITAFGTRKGETLSQWLLGDMQESEFLSLQNNLIKRLGVNLPA